MLVLVLAVIVVIVQSDERAGKINWYFIVIVVGDKA